LPPLGDVVGQLREGNGRCAASGPVDHGPGRWAEAHQRGHRRHRCDTGRQHVLPEQGVDELALAAFELADDRDVDQRLSELYGCFGGEAALGGREHLEVGENA
jgi:hypothetical protein